jgi:uncharacterized membrane protein YkvI
MKQVNAFGIGTTFVGVIVGAGFATDQELLQFFGGFGAKGLIGIIIAGIFFAIYASLIMLVARRINSDNYNLIIVPGGNKVFMVIVDIIMAFLMLLIFCVMVVGAGAQFNQFFGWPPLVGGIVMAALSVLTVFWGSKSLVASFNIVVPILVVLAVAISIISLIHVPSVEIADQTHTAQPNAMVGNWFLSALLYVLYNMLGAVVSLPNLGNQAKSDKEAVMGGIIGGAIIAILAGVLYTTVMSNAAQVITAPMPMLAVAKSLSPVAGALYMIVLFAAIYTTAAGFMFGIKARLDNIKSVTPKTRNILLIVIAVAALIGTRIGFVGLIATVYPFFGYIGIIIFVALLINFFYAKKKAAVSE